MLTLPPAPPSGAEPDTPAPEEEDAFHPRCLSLDLEVSGKDDRIHAFGAIRSDSDERLVYPGTATDPDPGTGPDAHPDAGPDPDPDADPGPDAGAATGPDVHSNAGPCPNPAPNLKTALTQLDALANGASFVLGHNLIDFDLPYLKAAKPNLRLLQLPAVDTLRLSPLAFPRNPYHALVKHYQDAGLRRGRINDPELDARLALALFDDELKALKAMPPDLLTAWHRLITPKPEDMDRALNNLFTLLRHGATRPSQAQAQAATERRLAGVACATQGREVATHAPQHGWALAYALAWLSVAGGNSVMPPWVRHQFPEAGQLVRRLRDCACTDPECEWCRERHDARKELKRWFGFDSFRTEPQCDDGRSMQQAIVETAMAGKHLLGILPTGTGKSLCYQIPALSRHDKTGALTVVLSPLVALMADQVAGLKAKGIDSCVTVNGMLSMPERADALDRVRLGDAAILLIAPEQLRSRSLRKVLDQREIGAWVLDEAHCLSRWGHDFRPDYRYAGRFIREQADGEPIPPLLCLTATARPDVEADITRYFQDQLGIALTVFNGGAERTNLRFEVIPTSGAEKFTHIHQVLMAHLSPETSGGAIIYCATRKQSEEVAEFLRLKAVAIEHFHSKLSPELKKDVQQRFIAGELRAIAATNAFGMGIDKPDVRLVIHADIPGSLENYLQEAGRAGRDRAPARCVLLYDTQGGVERQFSMSARSRLTRPEIHGILRALRRLDRKKRLPGEHVPGAVVATAGEILGEDEDEAFVRDEATDDTRVRTSIAWLEESGLLTREENMVQVFPSSLRVNSVEEARARLNKASITAEYREKLLRIAEMLIEADADEGVTTDELRAASGLSPKGVCRALYDLERLGIASNDTALTAFVHAGVVRASVKRLDQAEALEDALIACIREAAPDMDKGETESFHLRIAAQRLRDQGLDDPLPERLWRILRGIAWDGRGESGRGGSLTVRRQSPETVRVTLCREWSALEETTRRRRAAARLLLQHLLSCLPSGTRGTDLLAETTLGRLLQALESDLVLRSNVRDTSKLLDRALLWLHELEIIRLNKGLAVFRPAMTIHLRKERRGRGFTFTQADFEPLALHYQGQTLQIHVMAAFAERGLTAISEALRLAMDYFTLKEEQFLSRWLPRRGNEIRRQTTPESWQRIVEDLKNPDQRRIVVDDREQTSVLVLAGPGSGKTRVLVHRIAYLVRARREKPRGILALTYNRHAAVEIRRRLAALIGDDARGVTVLTCHALAMRLAGVSFTDRAERPDERSDEDMFQKVMRQAVELLRGEGLPSEEADEQRERLLAGFRWILVDEYQDVGPDQYDLISALAGRTLAEDAGRLTLFAVGDDDQNIYAFAGASVEFIRRFEADYGSKPSWLTENYRSTRHIIEAANAVIEPARERMKTDHPIHVNRARARDPQGGPWEKLDPVARGRVQILPVPRNRVSQARAVMTEFQRLSGLAPAWDWSRCAVIARNWKELVPVRAFCEVYGIPVQMANEKIPGFWRLRETRTLVAWLRKREPRLIDGAALRDWLKPRPKNPWNALLHQAVEEHVLECGDGERPVDHFIEWLAEWSREVRRRQQGLLLLTGHRAKGLEFDLMAVLDGNWDCIGKDEDPDAPRRLYYVAMTRARHTLILARFPGAHPLQEALHDHPAVLHREAVAFDPPPPQTLGVREGGTSPDLQALEYHHVQASLGDVDLGFAGRRRRQNRVHSAIDALATGDPLEVRITSSGRWKLLDRDGTTVGHLAKRFKPPSGTRCRAAEVLGIVGRSREDSQLEYRDQVKCETWEVVVPQLVFEPDQ